MGCCLRPTPESELKNIALTDHTNSSYRDIHTIKDTVERCTLPGIYAMPEVATWPLASAGADTTDRTAARRRLRAPKPDYCKR